MDLDDVEKNVTKLEIQYNPNSAKKRTFSEPKFEIVEKKEKAEVASQSPPRNFYPPGFPAGSD